jgi:hypothetical protein
VAFDRELLTITNPGLTPNPQMLACEVSTVICTGKLPGVPVQRALSSHGSGLGAI